MTAQDQLAQAGLERAATDKGLAASLMVFEGECLRGDGRRTEAASEAAHAALAELLDAISGLVALCRKSMGSDR